MKRALFASVVVGFGAFAGCGGQEPSTVVSTGGTGAGATGGSSGASASGGSAGTVAGTGGSLGGTGATSGTAGGATGGTAGSVTGGTAGLGGTGNGAGLGGGSGLGGTGAVSGAGMGGIAGTMAGSAGDTGGIGGAGAGGAGAGGTSGSAGANGGAGTGGMSGDGGTGGSACPSVAELFPAMGNMGSLDGRLVTTPCATTNSDDCDGGGWIYQGQTSPCMNGSLNAQQDFTVAGTPGAMYTVMIHFYGVVEPKNYGNMVTREAGNTRPTNSLTGASPAPWAQANGGVTYPASDYNTYEIHVLDNNNQEIHEYFLNSDTQEGHWTYLLNYEREITVVGGGKVRMRTYDRNCRMIKNCGVRTGGISIDACRAATKQTISTSAAMPQPMGLTQPGLGQPDDQSGQWLFLDVMSVTCM